MALDKLRNPFWIGALTLIGAFIVVVVDGQGDSTTLATPIATGAAFATFFVIVGYVLIHWIRDRRRSNGHKRTHP